MTCETCGKPATHICRSYLFCRVCALAHRLTCPICIARRARAEWLKKLTMKDELAP